MPVEEEVDDPDKPGEKKWATVEKEVNDPLGRYSATWRVLQPGGGGSGLYGARGS